MNTTGFQPARRIGMFNSGCNEIGYGEGITNAEDVDLFVGFGEG